MGDLDGRVMMVTGANTGIGRVTAERLAARGAHVVVTSRTRERAQPVLDAIASSGGEASFLALELGSLAAVRRAADDLLSRDQPLHVLIHNAGLAGQRGVTDDGFEIHFGVNHLGPFLLTMLLRERLVASAPARVVFVASRAHTRVDGIDYDAVQRSTRTLTGFREYSVSKLANVWCSAELARRLEGTGVTSNSLHPGVVASDVWRRVPWPLRPLIKRYMLTPEEGAQTTIHCAAAPELEGHTGGYYDRERRVEPSEAGSDAASAAELWRRSCSWCDVERDLRDDD